MGLKRSFPVARIGEVEVGRTKLFTCGLFTGIVFNDQGVLKAYINRCTHMGGPVELLHGKERFRCRWHRAEFDAKSGEAIEGEAPKGTRLEPLELKREGDVFFAVVELPDDPFSF